MTNSPRRPLGFGPEHPRAARDGKAAEPGRGLVRAADADIDGGLPYRPGIALEDLRARGVLGRRPSTGAGIPRTPRVLRSDDPPGPYA
ncbi:hypothetical protein [Streptomyces tsukubensis]|uniref:hypothetical protein n=1 Tax=Streptomyces tsukubensis TaxID=83656 RepID=UPI00344F9F07